MNASNTSIAQQVKKFCVQIGADPLLVQGAGGNVSWKDGDALWVKASGTWIAEAESKEIFVPVDLAHLQNAIAMQEFSVKPEVSGKSGLRPSIETLLHALMPHRVVVHLHVVEILAHLVKANPRRIIETFVGDEARWIFVDYFKPGADLARATSKQLEHKPDADVVFMGNHGVVIGGRDVDEVQTTLHNLIMRLKSKVPQSLPAICPFTRESDFFSRGYVPCFDKDLGLLAIKDNFLNKVRYEWALYPDHVVFLGAGAIILERNFTIQELDDCVRHTPPFIFAIGDGVYECLATTAAQRSQLRCYYDVLSRQGLQEKNSRLTNQQVSELLEWDAEKFRQSSSF